MLCRLSPTWCRAAAPEGRRLAGQRRAPGAPRARRRQGAPWPRPPLRWPRPLGAGHAPRAASRGRGKAALAGAGGGWWWWLAGVYSPLPPYLYPNTFILQTVSWVLFKWPRARVLLRGVVFLLAVCAEGSSLVLQSSCSDPLSQSSDGANEQLIKI